MCPQRNNKVVDPVAGIIGSQNNRLVLPLVIPGVSVAAMLANLRQLQAAQRLLFFQQVAEGRADADVGRHRRKTLHDAAQNIDHPL